MAWVRLDDKVMTSPKIYGLSDKAFRLWVWGLCYCQQHLTDGQLPTTAISSMPARLRRASSDLAQAGLWTQQPGGGFTVRDFLQWNDSKAVIAQKREAAKSRMRGFRSREHPQAPTREVPDGCGVGEDFPEKGSGEKPAQDLERRAGRLREELYPAWYAKYRHGARLRLIASPKEFQEAVALVRTWDDARLEKLARIVLTTDDDFISKTDRGFHIFALKASWADDRLRQVEAVAR